MAPARPLKLTLRVEIAPWVGKYLDNLAAYCKATGAEPDMQALRGIVGRGIRMVPVQRAGTAQPPGGPTTP